MALMPQAGVAPGMVLVVTQRFPDLGDIILPVVIAATVLFEMAGPVLTRHALTRVGEVPPDQHKREDTPGGTAPDGEVCG